MRRSRRESVLLGLIAVAFLVVCSVVAGFVSQGQHVDPQEAEERAGDPVDATGMVDKKGLLAPDRPQRGAAAPARFVLVEFADFQCASCAKAQPILRDLLKRRTDVRLVFRHCPLLVEHPNAVIAARAAEAARRQNKFWEMHDALYRRQADWMYAGDAAAALTDLARSVGLDGRRVAADLTPRKDDEVTRRIQDDLRIADQASVQGTPAFFLITPTRVWVAVGPKGLERLRDGEEYWR